MKKQTTLLCALMVFVMNCVHAETGMEGKKAPPIPGVDAFGGKPVLVDFWASWCGPCQESFPWMSAMKEKYPELEIIAVNLDESQKDAKRFLDGNEPNFEIVFDPEGDLAEKYQVDGMPSSYLIDRNGVIVKQHVGFYGEETASYENDIQSLLQPGSDEAPKDAPDSADSSAN